MSVAANARPAGSPWLRSLGDRVVQHAMPKGEKQDHATKELFDRVFAVFRTQTVLAPARPNSHGYVADSRSAQSGPESDDLVQPDIRAAGVFRLRGTATLAVVSAVHVDGGAYELRVHLRAPRNLTNASNPDALVHVRLAADDSRRLLDQLVPCDSVSTVMSTSGNTGAGPDHFCINRHHPHVLSILTRMAELDNLLVQEARDLDDAPAVDTACAVSANVVIVAFSPLPAAAEEVLCLVGHSGAFLCGSTFPPEVAHHESQLRDVLGRDYIGECGLTPTLECARLVCERASWFAPTTRRNGVFDRLVNFDQFLEDALDGAEIVRLGKKVLGGAGAGGGGSGAATAPATASAMPSHSHSPPSPTPSSVGSDEEPSVPPVIPSNQGKRPASSTKGKPKAAAKKQRVEEESDESDDDEVEEESEEEDVSDEDGDDAFEEDNDETEGEEEATEEPVPPPKRSKPRTPSTPASSEAPAPASAPALGQPRESNSERTARMAGVLAREMRGAFADVLAPQWVAALQNAEEEADERNDCNRALQTFYNVAWDALRTVQHNNDPANRANAYAVGVGTLPRLKASVAGVKAVLDGLERLERDAERVVEQQQRANGRAGDA